MKKFLMILFFLALTSEGFCQLLPNLGGQRKGTSSLQFLKIGNGARSTGMGESYVAVADDISSLAWNPAGLTQFQENGFMASHTQWFVDTRLEYLGGVYHFGGVNAVGLSVTALNTDDELVRTEVNPGGNGNTFKYSDIAIGLTFSRKMTDQFSFGVTAKYVEETLGLLKMRGVLGDIGTFYRTGLGTSRFSVVISNFGGQLTPTGTVTQTNGNELSNFQRFPPPTLFRIGFAIEPWMNQNNRITTSVQLNSPNDNAEFVNLGAEYAYKEFLFFRGGYKFNVDAETFSFGAGFKVPISFAKANFDYSMSQYKDLGLAQRISLNILFAKK